MNTERDNQEFPEEAQALKALWNLRVSKITQEQFGLKYGLGGQANVGHYLNGRQPLNVEAAVAFATELGVSVTKFSPRLASRLADLQLLNPVMEPAPANHLVRNGKGVPVVGTAQLGAEGFWVELQHPAGHGDGILRYNSNDRNAYALRVTGSSMEPRIRNGEFVVIEPNHACSPGDEVLVVTSDGRSMVKELLYIRDGVVTLSSVNASHGRVTLRAEEIEKMHYVVAITKSSLFQPA
jgi:phage repressor protein C with HTH and peptisase S24 domain